MPLNEALREYNAKRSEGKEKAGVSKKERDASRIQIECVDTPDGKNDGYIVCVTPKPKKGKEGKGEGRLLRAECGESRRRRWRRRRAA
jgi:hypothetical protein